MVVDAPRAGSAAEATDAVEATNRMASKLQRCCVHATLGSDDSAALATAAQGSCRVSFPTPLQKILTF